MTKRKPRFPFESLPGEVWRRTPYPLYDVSNLGRVRTIESASKGMMVRKPNVKNNGYLEVNLWHDGGYKYVLVHRLVLLTFIGEPPSERFVARHLDGEQTNNRLDNLAWGSHRENEADKVAHGTKVVGEKTNSAKLTEDAVREIRRAWNEREGYLWGGSALARRYGVSNCTVHRAATGRQWSHVR